MVSSPPGFDPDNMSSGKSIDVPVSLLDIVPTIMDWHNISMPLYSILKQPISYTGLSLLSKRQENVPSNLQLIISSDHAYVIYSQTVTPFLQNNIDCENGSSDSIT